jgi:CheY-like chemotaxis protein
MGNGRGHVLIVDDSPDDREMYDHHLTMKGYKVTTAADGVEGLVKAFNLRPNLILLDLRLPTLGGLETMRLLKADPRTKDCPVIIITGYVWHPPKTSQYDGWLTKPCPLDQLEAEVARTMKPSQPRIQ